MSGVRFCIGQRETQNVAITCDIIRLALVSMRLMGKGTAVKTALIVPLLMAPMTSEALSMTSGWF